MSTAAIFLDALPPETQADARTITDLEARLARLEADGHAAWPGLPLGDGVFLEGLVDRLGRFPSAKGVDDWLEHVHPGDFHLTLACITRVTGAIEAFAAAHRDELDRIARRKSSDEAFIEDALQSLWTRLFVGREGRPKLADYSGQGFLQNWLRVTATRTFIDYKRSVARHENREATEEDDARLLRIPDDADVELDFLKREYRAQFKESFEASACALSSAQRNLLRQHLVAGIGVHQLGKLYNVHASTISRRVSRAREDLLLGTRRELIARLEVSPEDFDSIVEMIRSRLDLSMSRVLDAALDDERA